MPYRSHNSLRFEPPEEFDTPEEVDAVFRAQRRISFTYGGVFLALTLMIPLLSSTSDYWNDVPVWGGFTLNYLVVAVLFHLFYIVLAVAYTLQSNRLEEELLDRGGGRGAGEPPWD